MTQEEKDLLLRDICARLPYGVKVYFKGEIALLFSVSPAQGFPITLDKTPTKGGGLINVSEEEIGEVKPYLRPLSSITEEEIYDFAKKLVGGLPHDIDVEERSCLVSCNYGYTDIDMEFCVDDMVSGQYGPEGYDLLLANHFDYRGLIEKGLAIAVTEDDNPYKD